MSQENCKELEGWINKGKFGLMAEGLFADMCMRKNWITAIEVFDVYEFLPKIFREDPKAMQLANDILIKISANDAAREKQFRNAELTLGSFIMQT